MPCRNQFERQVEEPVPVFGLHLLQADPVGPLHQRLVVRKIVSRYEGVLREEFMVGRQVLEQLDHGRRDIAADADKILGQADLVENRADIGLACKMIETELCAERRPEQQVFGHAGIGVELFCVECLDQVVESQFLKARAEL